MQDKFWRIIAALMCVGLFYVGHGLHGPQCTGLPSLESAAQAADVAWYPDSTEMFTASQDGRTVYTWKRFKDVREGAIGVRYMGLTAVPTEPRPHLAPDLAPGQFRGGAPVQDSSPRQAPEQPPFKK